MGEEKFKTVVCIEKDGTVFVVLYDRKDKPVRKVFVYTDGRVAFGDYAADPSKFHEYIVLRPIRR